MSMTTVMENVTSSTNATSRDKEVLFERLVELAIVRYAFPVVVAVGTLGNLTSLIVLLRPNMRGKSVYLFLLFLAIADTTVLYISAFKTWIRKISGFELLNVNDWSCRIVIFLILLSQHLAAWIVVLVTIDRFVAVWFPLRATSWCTVTRASIATTICTFIIVIYSGHVFWTFELDEYHRCMPKMVDGEIISFMLGPFNHMRFVTYCLLPFVVIMILNILIVARLRWTPQRVRHGLAGNRTPVSIGLDASSIVVATTVGGASCSTARMANTSASASTSAVALRQQQQSRVTYMLLVVSLAWLLLTTPYAVFTLGLRYFPSDRQTKATLRLTRVVCFLLMYINHAINFLLYCLTGRKFRAELKEMLASVFRRPARRWVATSLTMRTTRSNCVELEPLNDTVRTPGTHHGTAHRKFFVGDPANEVLVESRGVNDDAFACNSDGHVQEDAV